MKLNLFSSLQTSCRLIAATFAWLVLVGCSSSPDSVKTYQVSADAPSALGNVEYHTSELADELFGGLKPRSQYRFAVAGFVSVSSLKFEGRQQHPMMLLGHQLEQGMMTEAHRRGFITQDYKVSDDIIIDVNSDRVLSRQTKDLRENNNVDFYITGTITEQQEGAIVNARIVHARSKDVVAAATKFFPSELFWERERVTSRHGMLYRTGS